MSRFVVATAGHVDHGKSTLVGALTGIDTDRWAEEKARGLTIDLGFAWMELPSGNEVAFVDVPGHEKFLSNMLAGLGPAPVVCFVVAVDEGWQEQSTDHRDALAALGIRHGIIALTRADRAPDRVAEVEAQVRSELAGTGLELAPAIPVSAPTGTGIAEFTAALDDVLAHVPAPDPKARIRMWVDRAFAISGAGTVVTGTLSGGTISRGGRVDVLTEDAQYSLDVRGLQSEDKPAETLGPVVRAAINLRGVSADQLHRGSVLLTPDAWLLTESVDVRRATDSALSSAPHELVAHIGTAQVPVHVRPFDDQHARLILSRPLPLTVGDRIVLRGTGDRLVFGGVEVLDTDPPNLERRGAGRRRAAELEKYPTAGQDTQLQRQQASTSGTEIADSPGDAAAPEPSLTRAEIEIERRGVVQTSWLRRAGIIVPDPLPKNLHSVNNWIVNRSAFDHWTSQLRSAVAAEHRRDALSPGLTTGAAVKALGLPEASLLGTIIAAAGLHHAAGRISDPSQQQGMGAAEAGIAALEAHLHEQPFVAPEADDLARWKLGARELATAQRLGRILRLPDEVVLLPKAPAQAMRVLSGLPQPFTTSQARQALGTTRRVAIPLLEYLDSKGWTRRVDGSRRKVVR